MISAPLVIGVSFAYLLLLFAVASFGDRRAAQGRSVIGNAWTYALSMAVYCSAWTYFGSVGRAASAGRVVPAHLPGPDAGDDPGLDGGAQDDPHRAQLPHHLDRRLHLQPLRQEPAARRAGDADHRGRHRALHRAAAEGHFRRLCADDHAARPAAGAQRALVQRQHAVHRAGAGRFHHRLRRAPPRQRRAPRRHGRGHRLRVDRQAAGLRGGGRLRRLGAVRRPGRPVRARHGRARAGQAAQPEPGQGLRLRTVVRADAAVDAVGDLPAAPVPGDGGGERRRTAPQARRLGVPAVPAADQPVRAADRAGRAAALRPRRRCRRLRAVAAAGQRAHGAGAAGLRRRVVGGHRHGHRRGHRRLHDGVQRPGHAAAAAHAPLRRAGPCGRRRPDALPARHPPRRHHRHPAAGLPVLPPGRRGLCAGQHRAHQLCRGGAVRAGHARRHVLEGRHAPWCAGRAAVRLRAVGLHADAALAGQVGLAGGRLPDPRPLRAGAAASPSNCSACAAWTT